MAGYADILDYTTCRYAIIAINAVTCGSTCGTTYTYDGDVQSGYGSYYEYGCSTVSYSDYAKHFSGKMNTYSGAPTSGTDVSRDDFVYCAPIEVDDGAEGRVRFGNL